MKSSCNALSTVCRLVDAACCPRSATTGFCRAVAQLRIAAEAPAEQRHGGILRDVGLERGQVDVGSASRSDWRPAGCGVTSPFTLNEPVVDRSRATRSPASPDRGSLPSTCSDSGASTIFAVGMSAAILGRDVRIVQVEFMQLELPGGPRSVLRRAPGLRAERRCGSRAALRLGRRGGAAELQQVDRAVRLQPRRRP